MSEFLLSYYLWLKAFHIISFTAWMAGMFYLPRLYAYHAKAAKGSDQCETFKVMERRLLKIIINPAMILTFLFGGLMLVANPSLFAGGWMHVKLTAVIGLIVCHVLFAKWRKVFARDENTKSAKFYKIWNEVPTVLMILIVILAVVKPF